jgi:hypothetical protein
MGLFFRFLIMDAALWIVNFLLALLLFGLAAFLGDQSLDVMEVIYVLITIAMTIYCHVQNFLKKNSGSFQSALALVSLSLVNMWLLVSIFFINFLIVSGIYARYLPGLI